MDIRWWIKLFLRCLKFSGRRFVDYIETGVSPVFTLKDEGQNQPPQNLNRAAGDVPLSISSSTLTILPARRIRCL